MTASVLELPAPPATVPVTAIRRARLVTYPLVLMILSGNGALASFYLMLPVGAAAGAAGAGSATTLLMAGTVVAELVSARLTARLGERAIYAAGLVLLGAPALALLVGHELWLVAAVAFVRGIGFGLVTVVGGAVTPALLPADRLGEGLGLVGAASSVPSVVFLPLGVWLATNYGYAPACLLGAVTSLVGLAVIPKLPASVSGAVALAGTAGGEPVGLLRGLRRRGLGRPAAVFASTTVAIGALVAFLPLAAGGNVSASALLAQSVAATVFRFLAGRYGDRLGAHRLLAPAVLASAVGLALTALVGDGVAVVAGMALFGAGFGAAQNLTNALMLRSVTPAGYGLVSALWNLAYDAGMGAGAAGFGIVAAGTGYPAAFLIAAALVLAVLPLTRGSLAGCRR
jgi:MFS family permease